MYRQYELSSLGSPVDRAKRTPPYLQVKRSLLNAITQGRIGVGDALPPERELARYFNVSRMTVRRALDDLAANKVVERKRGSGTYTLPRPLYHIVDRVLGFTDEARVLGFRPGSKCIEVTRISADEQLARTLETKAGQAVLRITRVRLADGAPLALQISHLAPHLESLPLDDLREGGSLYRTLATHYGIRPDHARQIVSARLPTAAERRYLELHRHQPVLDITRTTFDANHRAFEYVRSAYRGDYYKLVLDLTAHQPNAGT